MLARPERRGEPRGPLAGRRVVRRAARARPPGTRWRRPRAGRRPRPARASAGRAGTRRRSRAARAASGRSWARGRRRRRAVAREQREQVPLRLAGPAPDHRPLERAVDAGQVAVAWRMQMTPQRALAHTSHQRSSSSDHRAARRRRRRRRAAPRGSRSRARPRRAEAPRAHAHPAEVLGAVAGVDQLPVDQRGPAVLGDDEVGEPEVPVHDRRRRRRRRVQAQPAQAELERGMRLAEPVEMALERLDRGLGRRSPATPGAVAQLGLARAGTAGGSIACRRAAASATRATSTDAPAPSVRR